MLRIAFITKTLLRGGAEKQILILAEKLRGKEIDVCIIDWQQDKADPENIRNIENNSIRYLILSSHLFNLSSRLPIIQALTINQPATINQVTSNLGLSLKYQLPTIGN